MSKRVLNLKFFYGVMAILSSLVCSTSTFAAQGQPVDWQLNLQKGYSPIAHQIYTFHNMLLVIVTAIAVFVLALLIWVMIRYNEKANPEPSKTSHNTLIEVIWTVVPILILIVIAIPSFRLLYAQYSFPKADVTIKAIGNQWYWTYEYPDNEVSFDSVMLEDEELKKVRASGQEAPRLLAVDNQVVVPVNKVVHILVTASDVIHNWTIPAFGSKVDAVPGRITRTWFKAEKTGTYYGQCSELCGIRHAFMPIAVTVVTDEVYKKWLAAIKNDEDKARTLLIKANAEEKRRKRLAIAEDTNR